MRRPAIRRRLAVGAAVLACVLPPAEAAAVDDDATLTSLLARLADGVDHAPPEPRWATLAELAQHFRGRGQMALADYFGKEAVLAVRAARREGKATPPAKPGAPKLEQGAMFRQLAEGLADEGHIAEALQIVELLREGEFDDFVGRQPGWTDTEQGVELSSIERRMDAHWQGLAASARPREIGADAGGAAVDAWVTAARTVLLEMAAEAPAGVVASPRNLQAPPAAPSPPPSDGTLQVTMLLDSSNLTLFFSTSDWSSKTRIGWDAGQAAAEVGALLAALAGDEPALPRLRALYERIGRPIDRVARRLNVRRIVIQGDGALRYLPMAALFDGQEFLGQRYAIAMRARPVQPQPRELSAHPLHLEALGVSRQLPGQPALPGVMREVCAIVAGPVHGMDAADRGCGTRGIVPGEGWLNLQFTPARLAEATAAAAAGGRGLLHLSSHFDLRPGRMQQSSLELGNGDRLTLDAIAGMDFHGIDLVTLSSCETGLGGVDGADGREVEGLNLVFIRRGARAVLASLWRVDDSSTAALMVDFYRQLPGTEPAEALREAQAEVRAAPGWASPFHWAGFYVTTPP